MLRSVLFIILISTWLQVGSGQIRNDYNDGPYISILEDSLEVMWVHKGEINRETSFKTLPFNFSKEGLPKIQIDNFSIPKSKFQKYDNVSKYVALSDIHGQYQVFIDLLIAQKVIDEDLNWIYEDGHLVVVGDIMDRGDQVTESLWFLFQLEKKAESKGGKVHVLLGNHELMVMHGKIAYVNAKYRYTMGISGQMYTDLFSQASILGAWLRSKNIITVINDVGFVHGGFSMSVLKEESSLKKINEIFQDKIIPQGQKITENDRFMDLLYFQNGPLWYRGYAQPEGFDSDTADSIMTLLNLQKMVVGHTSMPNIVSAADGRIILVDSSIKFGKTGEVLVYENDQFYRGLLDGSQESLDDENSIVDGDINSPFQYIYSKKDLDWIVTIDADFGKLMGSLKIKEEYVPARVHMQNDTGDSADWEVRIRTRGNMRKRVCKVPPCKIDFSKETLKALGYGKNDKLKMVFPCSGSKFNQQALYREYSIYKLYEYVDTLSIRTRMTQMILKNGSKEKFKFNGFFIEDEEEYESRTGVRIIKKGKVTSNVINRHSYLRMVFFQYMILNTDFGISNKHNLEIVSSKNSRKPLVVPYDFDYSGMVNQPYAVPYEGFAIKDVRQRYFRGKEVTIAEVKMMREYFNSLRSDFESVVASSDLLDNRSKNNMSDDIKRFYDVLNNERRWKKAFHLK